MTQSKNTVFVTMTDKFMSGWGHADGLTNKLVIVCEDMDQADVVMENASNRDEMKHVNLCLNPPQYFRKTWGSDYELDGKYVQIKDKHDMPKWFEKNAF